MRTRQGATPTVCVHISDDIDAAVEANHADAPRAALAKEQLLRNAQHGVGQKFAPAIVGPPHQPVREAGAADFSRRILHRIAVLTDLQFQLSARRGRGKSERDTAAHLRR